MEIFMEFLHCTENSYQSSGTGGSRYSCWRVPVNCTGSTAILIYWIRWTLLTVDFAFRRHIYCHVVVTLESSLCPNFLPSLLSLDYIQLFAVVGIVHYPSKHGCSLKHGVTIEAMLLPHETIFLACGLLILHVWPILWCYLHIVPQTRENYYGFRRS